MFPDLLYSLELRQIWTFSLARISRCKVETGAPRPMKMGTIASPCPYDAVARHALQIGKSATSRDISLPITRNRFPISQGGPVTLRSRQSGDRREGESQQ